MLVLVILLGGTAVLRGETRNEEWKQCGGNDPDRAIEACSALIRSGQDTGINLAAVFYNRGLAQAHKGDYDLAIEDYAKPSALMQVLPTHFMAEVWRTRTSVITTVLSRTSITRSL